MVDKHDVVEALSAFIAAYVVSLPEAQNMEPTAVRAAVRDTIRELRKGKVRRLWDWGRHLYRATALGYGAFQAFSHPWLAQAVVAATWTCVRTIGRFAVPGLF
jgi:hypothetical protein